MNIYEKGIYVVIEHNKNLVKPLRFMNRIKQLEDDAWYLLGNSEEIEWVESSLSVDLSENCFDYIKLIRVNNELY